MLSLGDAIPHQVALIEGWTDLMFRYMDANNEVLAVGFFVGVFLSFGVDVVWFKGGGHPVLHG